MNHDAACSPFHSPHEPKMKTGTCNSSSAQMNAWNQAISGLSTDRKSGSVTILRSVSMRASAREIAHVVREA